MELRRQPLVSAHGELLSLNVPLTGPGWASFGIVQWSWPLWRTGPAGECRVPRSFLRPRGFGSEGSGAKMPLIPEVGARSSEHIFLIVSIAVIRGRDRKVPCKYLHKTYAKLGEVVLCLQLLRKILHIVWWIFRNFLCFENRGKGEVPRDGCINAPARHRSRSHRRLGSSR